MGREAGDLVSKSLCLDLADVVDDSLIYMEVVGQPRHKHAHLALGTRRVAGRGAHRQQHTYFP